MRAARKRPAALTPKTKSFILEGRVAELLEKLAVVLHTSESALVNAILEQGAEQKLGVLGLEQLKKLGLDELPKNRKKDLVRKFRPSGQALSKGRCAFCGDAFYIDQWAALVEIQRLAPGGRSEALLHHAHVACARDAKYRPGTRTTWSTVDKAPLLIWTSAAFENLRTECEAALKI